MQPPFLYDCAFFFFFFASVSVSVFFAIPLFFVFGSCGGWLHEGAQIWSSLCVIVETYIYLLKKGNVKVWHPQPAAGTALQ